MEQSDEPLKDLIAGRLLAKAEQETKTHQNSEVGERGDPLTAVATADTLALRADFVKIEKNLASLGFFTPSSKRIKDLKEKTITYRKEIEGKRVDATARILPSAKYGLPITADQDTYIAILKLITEIHRTKGRVANPIGFTSAELLHLQGKSVAGYHYKQLIEQLMCLKTSTIVSEGVVYLAGKKVWAKDAFSLFDRVVLFGAEFEDGTTARKHYVWLSEWQLENINNNYLIPIDFDTYKKLQNHIAKALVPLLQIWFYASRDEGLFEKRYDELTQILSIHSYKQPSRIKEQLGPSLDELKTYGYVAHWQIHPTTDRKAYKLIFYHGEKFHRDRRRRLAEKQNPPAPREETLVKQTESRQEPSSSAPVTASTLDTAPAEQGIDAGSLAELTKRGVARDQAIRLLEKAAPDQPILGQLELGDDIISKAPPGKFHNPPGFYVYLVKANVSIPPDFETSEKKRLREQATQERNREEAEKIRLELAYDDYRREQIDQYLAKNYTPDQYQELLKRKKDQLLSQNHKQFANWPAESLTAYAERQVRHDLTQWIPFMNFDTFCEQNRNQPQQLNLTDDSGASPATLAV